MGKYFSKDTEFTQYAVTEENTVDTTKAMPSADNLTQPLSDETKEHLSQTKKTSEATNDEEYIQIVKEQSDNMTKMVEEYSEKTKQEIENKFKRFAPAEIFERLNQLMFVVAQLNNKVTDIEYFIKNGNAAPDVPVQKESVVDNDMDNIPVSNNNQSDEISPQSIPSQNTIPSQSDVDKLKKKIANMKSGILPDEDYEDNSINLEEVFPGRDNEAYQAAYANMSKATSPKTKAAKPIPGKMKNITGF